MQSSNHHHHHANININSTSQPPTSEMMEKYKAAGAIATKALEIITKQCIPGAKVMRLCSEGDETILKLFQQSSYWPKVKGGVAFPTCISINNVICHFSPLNESKDSGESEWFWEALTEGCLVKIELGVHVDGFPAMIGHSFVVVGSSEEFKKQDDVSSSLQQSNDSTTNEESQKLLLATFKASQAVLGTLKVGGKSVDFDEQVCRVAHEHGLQAVQGALTYQIGHDSFDLPKQVPINLPESEKKKMPCFAFEKGEVYVVDIVLSTGDGRIRVSGLKPTVFRQIAPNGASGAAGKPANQMKLSTSKAVISEVNKKFGCLPFHLRSMNNVKRAKIGMFECLKHGCVASSEILIDKPGSLVARFLYTVVIGEDGPEMITTCKMP